ISKMREAVYDLLCAVLLGLGNMCLFLGYDTQMTIVEPVLRSVHERHPASIDEHAGFYGAGMCTVFFMFGSLVSPCVLCMLGSKKTLILGSLLFTLHLGSFQYIHYVPYYATAAAIGVGYAPHAYLVFYSGHGGYITEHSTKMTIARNSALTWALATSRIVLGLTARPTTATAGSAANSTSAVVAALAVNDTGIVDDVMNGTLLDVSPALNFREYSDGEIKIVYGAFALVSFIGNVIFVLIPTKNVGNSISARFGKQKLAFSDQMKKLLETFMDRRALQLVPLFCFLGVTTCFWVGAYPTTLVFSQKLSGYTYLPALYLVMIGAGEIIRTLLFLTAMVLALLSTPPAATYSPTNAASPMIEPKPWIVLVIALFLGMSDNSFNTSRTVLCSLVLPENIAQVFSMSKFYQPLTSSIVYFIAPMMSMTVHFQL
ncbi:hypothetical protein PMAYCL1PPCAC_13750, partial [Pristionchus mayeri]